jgi:hypothetical protein
MSTSRRRDHLEEVDHGYGKHITEDDDFHDAVQDGDVRNNPGDPPGETEVDTTPSHGFHSDSSPCQSHGKHFTMEDMISRMRWRTQYALPHPRARSSCTTGTGTNGR